MIPDDDGLHGPAGEVTECEYVEVGVEPLGVDVPAVCAVLLLGVDRVVGDARVQPQQDRLHRRVVLQQGVNSNESQPR